jgi:hypothetical protein
MVFAGESAGDDCIHQTGEDSVDPDEWPKPPWDNDSAAGVLRDLDHGAGYILGFHLVSRC